MNSDIHLKKIENISTDIETIGKALISTKLVIKGNNSPRSLNKVLGKTTSENIDRSKNEINDLFVLKLWSIFEIYLRDYIRNRIDLRQSEDELGKRLYQLIENNVDYWRLNEILSLLRENVFKDFPENKKLIGEAKHILQYRNWVAHGCSENNKPSHMNVTPNETAVIIQNLMRLLDSNR
jgi:hypothetical protein